MKSEDKIKELVDICTERIMEIIEEDYQQTRQDLEKDILILVLRLMGENLDTFSEEVSDVMVRWKSKAHAVLRGEHDYET